MSPRELCFSLKKKTKKHVNTSEGQDLRGRDGEDTNLKGEICGRVGY